MFRVPTGYYLLLLAVLIFANVSVYREIFAPRVLTVHVLDVGEKGFSVLLHTPNNKTILVDTGPDAGILRALGQALPVWQRRIDALILTSTKKSFVGGVPDLTLRYHINHTLTSGTHFILDRDTSVDVASADSIKISYGPTSFLISSSTPKNAYRLDGETITGSY